ncbi:hypothetical protein GGQ74_000078 [Desulfobaculum xiamenense]|uniref:Uncharacterized protein n=1 Tax=Desulfobaculum xiamenense TaxID=995050 RepID=A0A846QDH7_9BACT|nr:phage tail tube protein [Desulfobaculum xiamenense]NJB66438.1 hypothetical protein [Desulfobaculum xiamenense]
MLFRDKLTTRQALFAKIETTYGEDAAPTAADALMMLSGATVNPQGEAVANDRISSTLSPVAHVNGKLQSGYTGRHELRGGGLDGTAVRRPETDALLRACAMRAEAVVFVPTASSPADFTPGEGVSGGSGSGTLVAVVNAHGVTGLLLDAVTGAFAEADTLTGADSAATCAASAAPLTGWQYRPTSEAGDMESATLHVYLDGHRHALPGARGTFSLELPSAAPGIFNFTLSGRYVRPVEATQPVPALDATLPPLAVAMGLTVGGYAPHGVTSLSFELANTVTRDEDLNAPDGVRGFSVTDRTPTGTLDPKADSLDSDNPFAAWETGETARIQALVGSRAGNRVLVLAPAAQHAQAPAYADREGRTTYTLNFELKGVAGDDELRLIYF